MLLDFMMWKALTGRIHEAKGMPTTTLHFASHQQSGKRLRHAVNLSRGSQRGAEMEQKRKTLGASPHSSLLQSTDCCQPKDLTELWADIKDRSLGDG